MQLNGVGEEHSLASHQITNCMHEHAARKSGGAAGAGGKSVVSAEKSTTEQMLTMSGWFQSIRSGGKKLWGRIWGDNSTGAEDPAALSQQAAQNAGVLGQQALRASQNVKLPQNTALPQNVTEVSELARAAAQSALVPGQAKENPYFMPIVQENKEKTGWEKIKIKFQTITKYLSHNFSGKDKFRNGQERQAKDLSKRSQYRGTDVKIDCVLTDDSYLLDSYDRSGSYAKLSPRK